MAWQVYAIIWFATLILGELLAPKPKSTVRPASLGDFQFPTAQEGRVVPVCWGRNEVRGANLVWYGDYRAVAIKEKVKSGLFSSSKITVGYRYYVGMQFAICIGQATTLKKIKFGEKTVWEGSAMNEVVYANAQNAFGGEDSEGGIQAYFAVQDGNAAQTLDPYLLQQFGAGNSPAYRGTTQIVMYGPSGSSIGGGAPTGYVGTTPYIKAPAFQIERFPANLGGGYENVGGDANPIECLFEILNSRIFGCGIPLLRIDTAAFQAAAATCHAEGNGFSMMWDRKSKGTDIAKTILEQVDGVLYTDPATGKLTIKLARDDYVIGSLPIFDPSNVLELENFSRGGFSGATSEVSISYEDAANDYKTRSITAHNAAVWEVEESVQPYAVDFPGVRTAQLAADLATRELRALSYTPAKLTIITNREAHNAYPGMPFRFQWEEEIGVVDIVMRVTNVGLGDALDGRIKIDAIQDIFAIASATFTLPAPSGWVPPIGTATKLAHQMIMEAPYWANLVAGVALPDEPHIMMVASQPANDVKGYTMEAKLSTEATYQTYETVTDFSPIGESTQELLYSDVDGAGTLDVTNIAGMDLLGPATLEEISRGANLAIYDQEIIGYESVTDNLDGTYTLNNLWRGLLDTRPQDHKTGAHRAYRLYFLTNYGDARIEIAEMELYGADGDQLTDTLGGTCIENGHYSSYGCSLAFNESTGGTGWISTGVAGTWLGWDFGTPVEVVNVWLSPRTGTSATSYNRMPKDFDIQVSDDMVNWTTVKRVREASFTFATGDARNDETYPIYSDKKVRFISQGAAMATRAFTDNAIANARGITYTAIDVLDPAAADIISAETHGRALKPLPPANFKFNGTRYLDITPAIGDVTVSWEHRDRISQDEFVVTDTAGIDYGPEAGATHTLRLLKDDGTVLKTYSGLTANSQVIEEVDKVETLAAATQDLVEDWQDDSNTWAVKYDEGSYADPLTNHIYIDPGSNSSAGTTYLTTELDVSLLPIPQVSMKFRRVQTGSWYDDDNTDAAFNIYFFPDTSIHGTPQYSTGSWSYFLPRERGPFCYFSMRHDASKDLVAHARDVNEVYDPAGWVVIHPATSRNATEFDGTDWHEIAWYNKDGHVAVDYFINSILVGSREFTTIPWPTVSCKLALHLHSYARQITEDIYDMQIGYGSAGIAKQRAINYELWSVRGGLESTQKLTHRLLRHIQINAKSAALVVAAQNATILKQPDIFAGSGALTIAAGNATITKDTATINAGTGAVVVAAQNASISKI